ncbi:MAG: hypothetical protein ACFE8E_14150, partial [Candidatus Hodarchaeota archaeon]
IRAIGLGVSIDFLYDTRDKKFIYFIFCWTFWIIGVIFPIISDFAVGGSIKDFLLVLNAIFAAIGTIFYLGGIFKYFMTVSLKIIIAIIISFILVAFLLYIFVDYSLSILVSSNFLNIVMFSTYVVPPLKKKEFIKYMGKSIRWFYLPIAMSFIYLPSSIYISFSGESFGLYDSENILLILFNYIPPIVANVLLIILLVHLEYTISTREKFNLKDKYSHNLGNIMQVIYSSTDIIKSIAKLEKEQEDMLKLVEEKCKEAAQLIKEIRSI